MIFLTMGSVELGSQKSPLYIQYIHCKDPCPFWIVEMCIPTCIFHYFKLFTDNPMSFPMIIIFFMNVLVGNQAELSESVGSRLG
jgi:hypothetical protein